MKIITFSAFGRTYRIKRLTLEKIIVVKVLVTIGFLAVYVVPHEHAWAVGLAANLIWLWRT